MRILQTGETLNVSGIEELASTNCKSFQSELKAALPSTITRIDIDLTETGYVDCCGVGALVALRNHVRKCNANITFRLLNPRRPVHRLFALTGIDQVFQVHERGPLPARTADSLIPHGGEPLAGDSVGPALVV